MLNWNNQPLNSTISHFRRSFKLTCAVCFVMVKWKASLRYPQGMKITESIGLHSKENMRSEILLYRFREHILIRWLFVEDIHFLTITL